MADSNYTVELENFSGPLDVLLSLIEGQKLDICEVSLATVTKDYLEYMKSTSLDPNQTNWFLNIATKLILVKSRALLPQDDNQEIEEDLQDLTEQLQILSMFKRAAELLAQSSHSPLVQMPATPSNNANVSFDNISPQSLKMSMQSILVLEKPINKQAFKLKRQSNKQLRDALLLRLQKLQNVEIGSINSISSSPKEAVTMFMIILELLKTHQAELSVVNEQYNVEVLA